jgi:hypothetical protein
MLRALEVFALIFRASSSYRFKLGCARFDQERYYFHS